MLIVTIMLSNCMQLFTFVKRINTITINPNFRSVRSTASYFQDTVKFETSALNDRKMSLNPTRLNVPHLCITSVPDSPISLIFTLQPSILELQAILRKKLRMTPNYREHKIKNIPYMCC